MYRLSVENSYGAKKELTNCREYTVFNVKGITPPKTDINFSDDASDDGSTVNNKRVGRRNIVIYLTVNGEIEKNRLALYEYFPLKDTVTIYFENGSRKVYIEGEVEVVECDPFKKKQIAQISIICAKPYFKDVESIVSYFSEVQGMFTFPFSISESGMEFGVIKSEVRKSIINPGTIKTGLVIEMYAVGEVVNPVVYDVLKKTHIKLTFTMQAGDKIEIDTNTGKKKIRLLRDGVVTSILGYRYPDSSWLILKPGDNVFTYACDSGSTNLQITFKAPILYGGM